MLAGGKTLEGERKQLTVVFCDIVGSSALASELGAERFHQFINRFSKLALDTVHRYEGTINQFLGDGFMALFGAPIAHEDHARRAALAAIEIRDRAEVGVRIGLNSGFVVLGPIGDDLWIDYMAFGDTVIHAARLQTAAQPSEILMSDATARLVSGYISSTPAPDVQIKERELHPIRVVGVGPRTSRLDLPDHALTPFVGRDREIGALRDALGTASGGSGQIVDLVGDAGVGKSRVIYEFVREASERATIIEARCLSYGREFPYLPLLEIVRDVCRVSVGDGPDSVAAKVRATLSELALDQVHAPFLLYALDALRDDSELQSVDRPTIQGRIFQALRDLLVAKARQRPLALVIEDLHWIDATSQELLTELSVHVQSAPILLICTFRPEYHPPWSGQSFTTEEALQPLDPAASEQIVRTILGTQGASVSSIVARGEGNPFFLEELSRSVQDGMASDTPSLPGSVHEVLAARIDRLDEDQKRALRLAAVVGREFSAEIIEALWDGRGQPLAHIHELQRREFVNERPDTERRTFMFKHALTQEVAYDGLLQSQRQELHEAVGRTLEESYGEHADEYAELLAYHFRRSPDTERAVQYLELANRRAADRNALEEAYEYYRAARELSERLPDTETNRRRRVRLVLDQTREYHFRFRNQEYYDLLIAHEPIVRSLGDEGLLGGFYVQLGHREFVMSTDYRGARARLETALDLCDRAGNRDDATFAESLLIWVNMGLGDYERALSHRERVRGRLRSSYTSIATNFSHAAAALVHTAQGQWDAALGETEAGIAIGRERSDATIVSFLSMVRSDSQMERGDWVGGMESAQASLAAAPTEYFRGFAQLVLARALFHLGQPQQGLQIQGAIVGFLETYRHVFGWLYFAPALIEEQIAAGAHDDATSLLDRVQDYAKRCPAPRIYGKCCRLRAELGQLPIQRLRESLAELRRIRSENELALSLATLGRLERQAGNIDAAWEATQEALAIFERLDTLEQPERARAYLEGLARDRVSAGPAEQ